MTQQMTNDNRVLPMEGAYNVRDLGGYETKLGRTTRWGAFYRSSSLHNLTEKDQQSLMEKGVRTIVDLRQERERGERRNVFADSSVVAYRNVSLVNEQGTAMPSIDTLGDLYINMLDEAQPALLGVFTEVSDNVGGEALLFHCAAGKDRTGVVAALLLELAGVPHDTIVEEYALTEPCIAPMIDDLRRNPPPGISAEEYEKFLGSAPSNMKAMLQHLSARYGDAERYLLSIGLTSEQVSGLRARLVDEE